MTQPVHALGAVGSALNPVSYLPPSLWGGAADAAAAPKHDGDGTAASPPPRPDLPLSATRAPACTSYADDWLSAEERARECEVRALAAPSSRSLALFCLVWSCLSNPPACVCLHIAADSIPALFAPSVPPLYPLFTHSLPPPLLCARRPQTCRSFGVRCLGTDHPPDLVKRRWLEAPPPTVRPPLLQATATQAPREEGSDPFATLAAAGPSPKRSAFNHAPF